MAGSVSDLFCRGISQNVSIVTEVNVYRVGLVNIALFGLALLALVFLDQRVLFRSEHHWQIMISDGGFLRLF